MQTPLRFVVGTDFSECAGQALALAIELAVAGPARITLVHVSELGVDGRDDARLSRGADALAELVDRARSTRVEIQGVLRSGNAWTKLDNVATEVGASLIVVGRHGAGRGRGVGSSARNLVRHASRPVLTVAPDFDRLDSEARDTNRPNRKHNKS